MEVIQSPLRRDSRTVRGHSMENFSLETNLFRGLRSIIGRQPPVSLGTTNRRP